MFSAVPVGKFRPPETDTKEQTSDELTQIISKKITDIKNIHNKLKKIHQALNHIHKC